MSYTQGSVGSQSAELRRARCLGPLKSRNAADALSGNVAMSTSGSVSNT